MLDKKINILVLGSGGREDSISYWLRHSESTGFCDVTPGNAGTSTFKQHFEIDINDGDVVAKYALENNIDLVVVGPEDPLIHGVADKLREAGVAVFGPGAAGARIEGSKAFAKDVMERANVPTAAYASFSSKDDAIKYLETLSEPPVVKADGLAAGKGVVVAETMDEAKKAVESCFDGAFGDAGTRVVIEEKLYGPEVSLLTITDGKCVRHLQTAQDHKRALDEDKGPNTGGMGALCPVPFVDADELKVMQDINERVLAQLHAQGIDYKGVLYGGFMLTKDGPKVLEYNCRFGDPETQAILPLLKSDLAEVMYRAATETLDEIELEWSDESCVCVVLTAEGYPGSYKRGDIIEGIEDVQALDKCEAFFAGMGWSPMLLPCTNGGRVMACVGCADTLEQARTEAYKGVDLIKYTGKTYRSDIASKALKGRIAWQS